MSTLFECQMDKDIIEKFKIALMLNGEEKDEVINTMMLQYISSSFFQASQLYKPTATPKKTSRKAENARLSKEFGKLLDEL